MEAMESAVLSTKLTEILGFNLFRIKTPKLHLKKLHENP